MRVLVAEDEPRVAAAVARGLRRRVSNSGPALDPRRVDGLLEPFERGGRARDDCGAGLGLSIVRARDDRGAGLGLSIVRAVAEAHGGRVALDARPAGGLDVEVVLPRA